jgi:hypothetical protein
MPQLLRYAVAFALGALTVVAIYELAGVRRGGPSVVLIAPGVPPVTAGGPGGGVSGGGVSGTAAPAPGVSGIGPGGAVSGTAPAAGVSGTGAVSGTGTAPLDGAPIAWPRDVAAAYREAAVAQHLETFVGKPGLGTVEALDCVEFPCIALVAQDAAKASGGGMAALRKALNDLIADRHAGRSALALSSSQVGDRTYSAVSVMPPSDDDVRVRVQKRMQRLLADRAR